MKSLILHPTDISQWYALVTEAEAAVRLNLNEDTESYLVFLLLRFMQNPAFIESVLGLDCLIALQDPSPLGIEQLKIIGDKSLLVCGLFPGLAVKRHVTLDYYSQMGQAAYLTVSTHREQASAELYSQLSYSFTSLQKILQAMRSHFFEFRQAERDALWCDEDEAHTH